MKRIICLDALVANQIAAGEVVEKAASVIKELVENSLDAKATKIEIETQGGGIHLIRIRDNGEGILKEDLPLAFSRHATSKIQHASDLEAIMSLGFRGEALASIASVAKCTLSSQSIHSDEAWQIKIHPDLKTSVSPCAHAQGTTIEVADLFYNTPVRRKFLRSEKSENLAIEEIIKRLALSAPKVTFVYKQDDKVLKYYEGVDNVVGQSFMSKALPIALTEEGISISGWIGDPSLQKRHADCQYLFVNNRSIKDRSISHILRSLYQAHPGYVEGTYPAYVLFLNIDPSEVDVNVHPTKQEVRFSRSLKIYNAFRRSIENAWGNMSISVVKEEPQPSYQIPQKQATQKLSNKEPVLFEKRYIVVEDQAGIRIIDVKRHKKEMLSAYLCDPTKSIEKKPLLFPKSIDWRGISANMNSVIDKLHEYGFECRAEKNCLMILQLPFYVDRNFQEFSFPDVCKQEDIFDWLTTICHTHVLGQIDWSKIDISKIPSTYFTHEDILLNVSVSMSMSVP